MTPQVDVLVVGAGPGGLVAAATAAEAGMNVCLVDDNPFAGGQIWRAGIEQSNAHAARLVRRLQQERVQMCFGARAVDAPAPRTLRIERSGAFTDIEYGSLILATGARELFLPFHGWTLPGVFGAGGLQAFVKSGFDIRAKRVVVAGTGPLLLAVAAHLRAAGARIVSVVEQAPMRRLARFSLGLARGHIGKLAEGAQYALSTAGKYCTDAWVASALGHQKLEKITVHSGSRVDEIACDLLAVGYHLVPNTELPQLLHCETDGRFVRVNDFQEASVRGIYCIGELTGIGGLDKAQVEGRIAALAAAGKTESARSLFPHRDRHVRFARNLAAAFSLRGELRHLAAGSTLVCRCEDVPYEAISHCRSWREAKLHTRCGMGPCQGRICAPATEFLFGWKPPSPRPPLFPVDIETLASDQN
jgi:NADPH-dependent 2,4-dienoyl-CoA reductase/sulfur reductase-like enzyme